MRTSTIRLVPLMLFLAGCSSGKLVDPSPGPAIIALPKGLTPEGMTFGSGATFYVGSIMTGDIWAGDARTGSGRMLTAASPGRSATGIRYDQKHDRLFVAGGFTGQAYVYDATSGATLAIYQLADPVLVESGLSLINDLVILDDAVYFTDSFQPVLYRIPLGNGGALSDPASVQAISLTGDYTFVPGGFEVAFNGNGIVATSVPKQLILNNTDEGGLYLVNSQTGSTKRIDLGGGSLETGDGILLVDHTLYVVQGGLNQVAVVTLSPNYESGAIGPAITDPRFAVPSSVGALGKALYVLNARFDVAPPGLPAPDVEFQVVRVTR